MVTDTLICNLPFYTLSTSILVYAVKQWAFHPFFAVFLVVVCLFFCMWLIIMNMIFGGIFLEFFLKISGVLLGVLTLHRNNGRGHLALFLVLNC